MSWLNARHRHVVHTGGVHPAPPSANAYIDGMAVFRCSTVAVEAAAVAVVVADAAAVAAAAAAVHRHHTVAAVCTHAVPDDHNADDIPVYALHVPSTTLRSVHVMPVVVALVTATSLSADVSKREATTACVPQQNSDFDNHDGRGD